MISISQKAAEKAKAMINQEANDKVALRIFVAGGGCSGYKYGLALDDKIYEDDSVVEEHGVKLIVDSASAMFLEGSVVDYAESIMGSGFVVNNPNVTSSCACGQSFHFKQEPQAQSS